MRIAKREPFLLYLRREKIKELTDIKDLLKKILPNLKMDFLFDFDQVDEKFTNPEVNIFFWCILSNRIEIAKIFWKLGKVSSIII